MSVLRCRLGWLPTAEWAGVFVAQADGLYAEAGIDLELLVGGPGRPSAARAVAAGEAEVGLASDLLAVLHTIADGAPLRLLGATMGASPLGIAWPADRAVDGMADLAGATIGAGAAADQAVVDALFAAAGLAPDYTFVEIGGGVDELVSGPADAICCSTVAQPAVAARRGIALGTATFAELGLPMPADVVVATAATVEARRDDLVGFLRATAAGWEAVAVDPERAAALAHHAHGAALGATLEDAADEIARQAPFVGHGAVRGWPPLWIDVEELAASLAALTAAGVPDLPTPADIVDLTLLTDAHASWAGSMGRPPDGTRPVREGV